MTNKSRLQRDPLSEWEIHRRVVRVTHTQTNSSHLSIEEQCSECGQWLARSAAIHGPARNGSFVCPGKVFDARDQFMLTTALHDSDDSPDPDDRDPDEAA